MAGSGLYVPGYGYTNEKFKSRGTTKDNPLQNSTGSTNYRASFQEPTTGLWVTHNDGWDSDPGGLPTTPGALPTTTSSGGSRRSGGGGGGPAGPNVSSILALLNSFRPQKYTHTPLSIPDYKGQPFYEFDDSKYTDMRTRVNEGAAADMAAGNAAIDEARTQIDALPIGFQSGAYATDPGLSQAMERMLGAQGMPTSLNQRTLNEGVQADAAFGNVMALMGETARQGRQSDLLALEGDRRRMNESIQAQTRGMVGAIDLAMANALQQYEKDKWMYGESVARTNWEKNMQVSIANNQGQNQVAQANTQMANDANQNALNALLELAMAGRAVDASAYNRVTV